MSHVSRLATRAVLIASVLVALASASSAQTPVVPPAQTLTVSGTGLTYVAPDLAVIRVGVLTRADTPEEALRQHEADVAAVLGRVRRIGLADREISVLDLQLGEDHGRNGPEGYRATRTVSLTTDRLALVPELVAAVVAEGANRLEGVQYLRSETAEAEAEALVTAFGVARLKAERLAAAAGARLGPVDAVLEQGSGVVEVYRQGATAVGAVASLQAGTAGPGAYSTGQNAVRAGVTVRYRLAPVER